MTFHYLATPYAKYPHGRENAFRAACRAAACLTDSGVPVYCPIAHWHPIALFMEEKPREYWIELNKPHMRSAPSLIIIQMPGWDESEGIFAERCFFEEMKKPIKFLSWPMLPHYCNSLISAVS